MNKKLKAFALAFLLLTLITAILLGFTLGLTHPLPWIFIVALVVVIVLNKKMTESQFVTWKDEYSVGIDSIDQQHRKLLHLINQLQTAVYYSTGESFEQEALDELVGYTKTHFSYEEGLLEKYEYPGFEPHKAQHIEMINKVEEVLAMYKQDHETAMNNAVEYLKTWLIKHINGTDKEYSSFLIEKGVK